ncbi:MAG: hypothetical protein H6Q10_762, partial [Acidobacteria bacterium]|nr:hypothetical protein [Acidobacteriota bacterium]
MKPNSYSRLLQVTGFLLLALLLSGATAFAQAAPTGTTGQAAKAARAEDGYRTATALGGSRALICQIRTVKQLQREMSRPRTRARVATVLEQAGVSKAAADQTIAILASGDAAQLRDEAFPVGGTMEWMGLQSRGKPEVVRNVRWGGRRAFPAWQW